MLLSEVILKKEFSGVTDPNITFTLFFQFVVWV